MSGHRVQFADLPPNHQKGGPKFHKQTKSNLKVTSPEDSEHLSRRQLSPNGTAPPKGDAKGSRTVPRRHTLGGARGSREILAMQPPDMDKKREAFLEHLKQKYPHHASAIMGHQERLREQSFQGMLSSLHSELDIQRYLMRIRLPHRSRSPKHGPSPQSSVADQVDHLSLASLDSLDTMSEADTPTGFTRGSRVRASLPVVRSTNQTKDRSLGVLYLQYADETKQIRMPNEITSVDTVRALFVSAFPQHLTMKMLESPSVAVYVKDDMRNMYYELNDVRSITDHSCLKVYNKDPAQAFSHGPRPANGDARMHGEMLHGGRDNAHPLRQHPIGPPLHHSVQGTMPAASNSMPPSPSRIPFSPRQGSAPSSSTVPRERVSTANPAARSNSPCPSAILERRDVKPDEDMSNKSHSLARGNEGLYADPYLLQEGRLSMASSHGAHPNDGPEHGLGGFHRASIRSTSSYGGPSPTDSIDHPSLYRQKSRNSQLPTLGSKTPPPSPHRMAEVRMIDMHGGPPHGLPPHGVPIERSSPVRQSFRKEEVAGTKPRHSVGSPVIADLQGHLQGPIPAPSDHQTRERMKAMEQQIASLTGLVQHALLKGSNASGNKEPASERPPKTASPAHSANSSGGSPILAPKTNPGPKGTSSAPLRVNLLQFRKNVSDLRMQLHQMRQIQLQNQEALRVQLKRAEQEISGKLAEAMRGLEDPVQRQRAVVEEDRHKYLSLEEHVLAQLSELEQYVVTLQKDSATTNRAVTLKDVEEGAVTLRKVGESLAGLKGEFPALQTRMRAVLRVEVEAVKFLKEEPHKLDSMLKRVKSLTDTLGSLRRCATEGSQKCPDLVANVPVSHSPSPSPPSSESPGNTLPVSTQPGPTSAPLEPQSSTIKSEVMPSSPVVIHHVQSSPVHIQQSQQSAALTVRSSPPLTPSPTNAPSPNPGKSQGRESPKTAAVDPASPAQCKKTRRNSANNGNGTKQDLVIEELQNSPDKSKKRVMSIEAAEKEWDEKRQNMGHYDGKEFEKILEEAQANMMKGIPSLEVEGRSAGAPAAAEQASTQDSAESPSGTEKPQTEPPSDTSSKKGPEKFPKPVLEKPAKPVLERPSRSVPRPSPADSLSKQECEKPNKSPPPPPPRKIFPGSGSGMTTTRSGEVVYINRKESVSSQEGDDDASPPTPKAKPTKVPPETKPKPATPPPVVSSAAGEEEDDGDKIMAELQVFQKCAVKEAGVENSVEPTTRVEPQIRELRSGSSLPLKEKKQGSEPSREDKEPVTDENGNTTVRQSQGIIYYVTGQIPKEQPPALGSEETPERREPAQTSSQVSNVTFNDNSPSQQQQQQQPPLSPPPKSPPPISPKPTGLKGFKLPRKHLKRSGSLKTSAEMEKGEILNKINTEKKGRVIQMQLSPKTIMPEPAPVSATTAGTEVSKPHLPPLKVPKSEEMVPKSPPEGDDEASLSPDLPGEEAPPPPDNIAFMITNTKVQALSCGEYQELVNAKKGRVQTVTVGSASPTRGDPADPNVPQDNGANKKPVIIIFDEPMDIRSAYKRLSTIFECEEELDRMLSEERIEEESEESDTDRTGGPQGKPGEMVVVDGKRVGPSQAASDRASVSSSSSSSNSDSGVNLESSGDAKQDGKKKFKFKFPKKQLAALTQAIRTGTKSGKKTLQVVVYEDEEEYDGTIRQHKEAKRFEIATSKPAVDTPKAPGPSALNRQNSDSVCRTNEIRKNTYKTLDSLEQTIKQLETTISEMGPRSPVERAVAEEPKAENGKSSEGAGVRRSSSLPKSRVSGPKNASVASPTSRMPVPLSAKARQAPGTTDKAGKQQKLQDAQRQFRQANGSAKRVGGDHKTSSPTVPVSKIPAFYPSSTKSSSQSVQNSDATNPINTSSSSSSVTKSSHTPRSSSLPSSHIPSLSNGSLKLPTPLQHSGKALSFSSQTQNGRVHCSSSFSSSSSSSSSSTSSSSPSPLSPTPLGQGGKSIRTIHTPSFTSYRSHNGSSGKSCIPTATAAKDAA
ncbi:sickle tail protein homolog isoform X6 [Takifugu rubripes]|uniref:sickle tail protein homolog isoform X6 n=1 Tax=Takifugu rubripes TaxID=31033 RepID=UPI00114562FE|nr:sickle tail protein homolog isoform X6 [Takifugu rubripes]